MLDVSGFEDISEYEEVEKVVYLVRARADGGHDSYRVEAVRNHNGKYSTRVYEEVSLVVQPSDIENGKPVPTRQVSVWVNANAPWTDRTTADDAIKQLLSLWEA